MYREQVRDSRWRVAHEKLSEAELPESVQRAFQAFERRLAEIGTAQPRQIDLQLGSEVETFFPNYDSMKIESLGWSVLAALFIWFLGVGLFSLLGVAAIFVLPEDLWGPALLGSLGLGAVVVGLWAFRSVVTTAGHNRVKRAARGRIAYGVFLLSDAIVQRYPGWAAYFPRDTVQAAEVERVAAHTSGGNRGPARHHGPESSLAIRYLAAAGQAKTTTLLTGLPGHQPEAAVRLRAWILPTGDARQDPSFQHTAADLQREDYARVWRSFKRRRVAAYVLLIGPWVLFIAMAFIDGYREATLLDDVLGTGFWPVPIAALGPGIIALLLYRLTRCPRCGKSPRQPLSGTNVTQCLSCGLPIFTKVQAPGR